MVDVSTFSSGEFDLIKQAIAFAVETEMAQETSRVGFVQYASKTSISFSLSSNETSVIADTIRSLPMYDDIAVHGTAQAMQFSFDYVWTISDILDMDRVQTTILITNGAPAESSCSMVDLYGINGIEIILISIGTIDNFPCFTDDMRVILPPARPHWYVTVNQALGAIESVLDLVNVCPNGQVQVSPYDGGYSRIEGSEWYPVYRSGNDYVAEWQGDLTGGFWQFSDPSGTLQSMVDDTPSLTPFPVGLHDWRIGTTIYSDLPIFCRDSPAPSRVPTPTLPTKYPSLSPTNDCEHFVFGPKCLIQEQQDMDLIIVFDSSTEVSDTDFSLFISNLQAGIDAGIFPQLNARFGLLTFADRPSLEIPFDYGTLEQWSNAVGSVTRSYGGRNLQTALMNAFTTMWSSNIVEGRETSTLIILSDVPDENPCQVLILYATMELKVVAILIGNAFIEYQANNEIFSCFASIPVYGYPAFKAASDAFRNLNLIYSDEFCTEEEQAMPFTGSYSRSEYKISNKPVYLHSENWRVEWTGVFPVGYWRFIDPTSQVGSLSDVSTYSSDLDYPITGHDWQDDDNLYDNLYTNVLIECVTTATPTRLPSSNPSLTPIESPTSMPSSVPTLSPSATDSPSKTPSTSPTYDCMHFYFGEKCNANSRTAIDIVYVLDSSSSITDDSYMDMQQAVADSIDLYFSNANSRFGLVYFATDPELRIDLGYYSETELPENIRSQSRIPQGATFTSDALAFTYTDVWEAEDRIDPTRRQITVVLTDGNPSEGQEPCPYADKYEDAGIELIFILLGIEPLDNPFDCFADATMMYFSNFTGAAQSLYTLADDLEFCDIILTPYDGRYSRTSTSSTHPVYRHSENWVVERIGNLGWTFRDPNDVLASMQTLIVPDQIYPASGLDWSYVESGDVTIYYEVPLICDNIPAPSRTPSLSPSTSPTTVNPTTGPTVDPTCFPTVEEPSVSPSVDPTVCPTSDTPSTYPSVDPTVTPSSPPSYKPSCSPTFSPSVSPSFRPSVVPSSAPTLDCLNFIVGDISGSSSSPYDGSYSRLPYPEYQNNGYPIYQHSENWVVEWVNYQADNVTSLWVWQFRDPAGVLGNLTDLLTTNQIYPVGGHPWLYGVQIIDVGIHCTNTTIPTRFPSVDPTLSPSSDQPSVSPSLSPSVVPTVDPTHAPTEDCLHFLVGECINEIPSGADFLFVVDTSSSVLDEDITVFLEGLTEVMRYSFPSDSTFAMMFFAEDQSLVVSWSNPSDTDISDIVVETSRVHGDVHTKDALEAAYEMWDDNIDGTRLQRTILVIENVPARGQDFCDSVHMFLDSRIEVVIMAISYPDVGLQCFVDEGISILSYDSFEDAAAAVGTSMDDDTVCEGTTSAYDGRYSRTGDMVNGYPTYQHKENWLVYWSDEFENWVFSDPVDIHGDMVNLGATNQIYPENRQPWRYYDPVSSDRNEIENLLIVCDNIPAPTRLPSMNPTTDPSGKPSVIPSQSPTSTFPSQYPTSDSPSMSPSCTKVLCYTGSHSPNDEFTGWYTPQSQASGRTLWYHIEESGIRLQYFEGFWTYFHPSGATMRQSTPTVSGENQPLDGQYWVFVSPDGQYDDAPELVFDCTCTWAPTDFPTMMPSLSPTTESPTKNPSVSPSVDPTALPSFSPSVIPTTSPSFCPSVSPSTNPSDFPSKTPTVNPTANPSTQPSFKPSVNPSDSPSSPPSCDPSVSPSQVPSFTPTMDCPSFWVGEYCDLNMNSNVDMVFLIESSYFISDYDFNLTMHSLATAIEDRLPSDSRFALLLYADDTALKKQLGHYDSRELASQIRSTERITGSSSPLIGMRNAFNNVFASNLNYDRPQVLILYIDRRFAESQSPCSEIRRFVVNSIDIILVTAGDSFLYLEDFQCFIDAGATIIPFDGVSTFDNVLDSIDACNGEQDVLTPFDGAYNMVIGSELDFRPTYQSPKGYIAQFDTNSWSFYDPSLQLGIMVDGTVDVFSYYPLTGHDWKWFDTYLNVQPFDDVPILCLTTSYPTLSPSSTTPSRFPTEAADTVSPTLSPSGYQSSPSLSPTTDSPSAFPSNDPSRTPSMIPSQAPSYAPSAETPTRSPSVSPTNLPTPPCDHFYVGRPCDFYHAINLDFLIVLDKYAPSISETEYEFFIYSLAEKIDASFADFNSQYGLLSFSDRVDTIQALEPITPQAFSETIGQCKRETDSWSDALNAMNRALVNVWESTDLDTPRSQVTVLVSFDGWEQAESPCSKVDDYVSLGIEIVVIAIGGDASLYTCFTNAGFSVYLFDNVAAAISEFDEIFMSIDVCADFEALTPYDGPYSIADLDSNGYPVYVGNENKECVWDPEGYWLFIDLDGNYGPMTSLTQSTQVYPVCCHDWQYSDSNSFVIHDNVPIICRETATPTRSPSRSPSASLPSKTPSESPSCSDEVCYVGPHLPNSLFEGWYYASDREVFGKPVWKRIDDDDISIYYQEVWIFLHPSDAIMRSTIPNEVRPQNGSDWVYTASGTEVEVFDLIFECSCTFPPSVTPSAFPNSSPPSGAPSGTTPTITPTQSPTESCDNFIVGDCPCIDSTQLDLVLILDVSESISDEDWETLKSNLVNQIETTFPYETARLGIVTFSTAVHLIQELIYGTREEHANAIRGLTKHDGATNIASALELTFKDIWEPTLTEERDRITTIMSDGVPTRGQDPCATAEELYKPNDITLVPVGFGSEIALNGDGFLQCMVTTVPVSLFDEFDSTVVPVAWSTFNNDCNGGTRDTAYNGFYNKINEIQNGKPVYEDPTTGYRAMFDEVWMFYDPDESMDPMIELGSTSYDYPISYQDWSCGAEPTYEDVIICCRQFTSPTLDPTLSPHRIPSSSPFIIPPPTTTPTTSNPSDVPSKTPSDTPSMQPSRSPSIQPSASLPSRDPSAGPTVSAPTQSPSKIPTFSSPTLNPSQNPFASTPTRSPSGMPTTEDPTNIPTVSPVASDPTRTPSNTPSTDDPTKAPSNAPSTSGPTRSPSEAPNSSGPSTSPTDYPSVAPTQSCDYFSFGLQCVLTPGLLSIPSTDVAWVVDTSPDVTVNDFDTLMNAIATYVESDFDSYTSRMALLLFATIPSTQIELEYSSSTAALAAEFRSQVRPTSMNARFTQWALEFVLNNVWGDKTDSSRTQQTVLVTNGEYSRGQDPCVYVSAYAEAGIDLILILVNTNATPYVCFSEAGFDIIVVENYDSINVGASLTSTNLVTICTEQGTPYDGYYEIVPIVSPGPDRYINENGYFIQYSGTAWVISDPTGVKADLFDESPANRNYPESGHDWRYGDALLFDNIVIVCYDNPQPSNVPTASLPSKAPTKFPTFDNPTKVPSKTPSYQPVAPTSNPTPSGPSYSPSTVPSVDPSVKPTTYPSSTQPSTSPTFMCEDSADCAHFYIGPTCNLGLAYSEGVDILLVVDSSDTISDSEYEYLQSNLADTVQQIFPDESRFGYTLFASFTQRLPVPGISTGEITDVSEFAEAIRTHERMSGPIDFVKAVEDAYLFSWANAIDQDRPQIAIFIISTGIAMDQAFCNLFSNYIGNGIEVVFFMIGDGLASYQAASEECLSEFNFFGFVSVISACDSFESAFNSIDICDDQLTPFDGSYTTSDIDANGYPIYRHSENYIVEFNPIQGESGFWTFSDPSNAIGTMYCLDLTTSHHPESEKDYRYFAAEFLSVLTYTDVPVTCVCTPTPTRVPSVSPSSSNPSFAPSASAPSRTPSGNPTTGKPTSTPSRLPSLSPSTTSPTRSPSVQPSTSTPTHTPSERPSTDQPSFFPTSDIPTNIPSRTPSMFPTSDTPTNVPSRSPSMSPTSDAPSKTPSESPSTEIPTATPSFSGPSKTPSITPTTTTPSENPTVSMPSYSPSYPPQIAQRNVTASPTASERPTASMPTSQPTHNCLIFIFGSDCVPDCKTFDVDTPFNGWYTRITTTTPPIFIGDGTQAAYSSVWTFFLNSGETLRSAGATLNLYPETGLDWILFQPDGWMRQYQNVPITCKDTMWPTTNPSVSPSTEEPSTTPSLNPTLFPSTTPTDLPSFSPTYFPTTEEPSNNPSFSPSSKPSAVPSRSPTMFPTTEEPSNNPSFSPSVKPSEVPSTSPTFFPTTDEPSMNPSFSPSTKPSAFPSRSPTLFPTTEEPSYDPSVSPSTTPTELPSKSPTKFPTTEEPSTSPSFFPSTKPTLSPSVIPSCSPSMQPSRSPTTQPSKAPTSDSPSTSPSRLPTSDQPSRCPTSDQPSMNPSVNPSVIPTNSPSVNPTQAPTTEQPTNSPSLDPSADQPSRTPSINPTVSPTLSPSVSPSKAPTSDQPSINPSTNPSVIPTYSPSVNPTQAPTTEQPTNSPSLDPSADQPSMQPTQAPSADQPSITPSVDPTKSPSTTPSFNPSTHPTRNPTTDEPTFDPSKTPSTTPTITPSSVPSYQPSQTPTRTPTVSPSFSAPSSSPLPCSHIYVGHRDCLTSASTNGDVVFILDSSSSISDDQYNLMMAAVQETIETKYANTGSRLGLALFASEPEIRITLTANDPSTLGEQFASEPRIPKGATFTEDALNDVFTGIWQGNLNSNRQQTTIVFTDGNPTESQNPCAAIPNYEAAGIDLVFVIVGSPDGDSGYACFEEMGATIHTYTEFSKAVSSLTSVAEDIGICDVQKTPYDGGYSRTYELGLNGFPTYAHSENFVLEFDSGFWRFSDPNGVYYDMLETEITTIYPIPPYPESLKNWHYIDEYIYMGTFNEVPIVCVAEATPTRVPSTAPAAPTEAPYCEKVACLVGEHQPTSVFSGWYYADFSVTIGGKPIWKFMDDPTVATLLYRQTWIFQHISGAQMQMIDASEESYPPDNADWVYAHITSNDFAEISGLSIDCRCTQRPSIPTQSPSTMAPSSHPVSTLPSKYPTSNIPSKYPTFSSPSELPSRSPTIEDPSLSPSSDSPTQNPSVSNPTEIPSVSPSNEEPSLSPSSDSPTKEPSSSIPSEMPSHSPSNHDPSISPSSETPTKTPSIGPSISPSSDTPTQTPSQSPTMDSPTRTPSITPSSDTPSGTPSQSPTTESPTKIPSVSPSFDEPSKFPTKMPSASPSFDEPSKSPTADQPTISPSSDTPTRSPSFIPTTDVPTKGPSVSPSANQPSRTPSTLPTETPTTTMPSTPPPTLSFPTMSPTSTEPTISPSLSLPSKPPSQSPTPSNPSMIPTSSIPSISPSYVPSCIPITSQPSITPSSTPSSVPSVAPTTRPTSPCTTFEFALNCENVTQSDLQTVDAVFILDSSSSVSDADYNLFIDALSRLILAGFFQEGFGLALYASFVQIKIDIGSYETSDLVAQIRATSRMLGSTMTETALRDAYQKMWEPSGIINATRDQRTLLITDGNPSPGQNPCNMIDNFLDAGIELQVIAIGEASNFTEAGNTFDCYSEKGVPVVGIASFVQLATEFQFTLENLDGTSCLIEQQYAGTYSWQEGSEPHTWTELFNGWEATYENGQWDFSDPSGVISNLSSSSEEASYYLPPHRDTWIESDGTSYENLTVTCLDNLPTAEPTDSPSSSYPTIQPTLSPSFTQPTQQPSSNPTVSPSQMPSTLPSTTPTTRPTLLPSFSFPSTTPTWSPSNSPSFSEPSKPPSTSPTLLPTFTPSQDPSISNPTGFPVFAFPTTQPSYEEPTTTPSITPTEVCATILFGTPCVPDQVSCTQQSPYDGIYNISGQIVNDRNVYNYLGDQRWTILYVSGLWTAIDFTGAQADLSEANRSFSYSIIDGATWILGDAFDEPLVVNVRCHVYVQPSTSPTQPPSSDSPTQSPVVSPPTIYPSSDSPTQYPSSDAPSHNPITARPSRYPSSESPSKHPSPVSPSNSPTSSSPSKSPSFNPSGLPSMLPTTDDPSLSPTFDQPTVCPSDNPVTAPSGSPSTTPSRFPSQVPTISPSRKPSLSPSTEEPSESPISTTSQPPYANLIVGDECPPEEEAEAIDLLIIMDSSTSVTDDEYGLFMNTLADVVQDFFPDNQGKFGLLLYATGTEIRIPLQSGEATHIADLIRGQARMIGGTNTEIAMFIALEDMWSGPGNVDQTKVQRTLIITDGAPSNGQDPCRELAYYIDYSIDIDAVLIGEAAASADVFQCFEDYGQSVLTYADFQTAIDDISFVVTGEVACNVTVSPFDGGYSIGEGYIDGYPWYYSAAGWILRYNATSQQWFFYDGSGSGGGGSGGDGSSGGSGGTGSDGGFSSGGSGTMTLIGSSTTAYPPSGSSWSWSWTNETIYYHNVVIRWSNTSIPTPTPSEIPSVTTTELPSIFPSFMPTGLPLVQPTGQPSSDPTPCSDALYSLDQWCANEVQKVYQNCANYSTCNPCFKEEVDTMNSQMYDMSVIIDASGTCLATQEQRMLMLQQTTESILALTSYMRNDSVPDYDPQDRSGHNETLVVPTPAPTEDCSSFIFGVNCAEDVDLVMLIDSSNTISDEDFSSIMTSLALGVENSLSDESARLGAYVFATVSENIIEFSGGDMSGKAEVLRNQRRIGGATFTDDVFDRAWNEIWDSNKDSQRNQIHLLVTDGAPTENHSPCDNLDRFVTEGIALIVVAVGDSAESDFTCFTDNGARVIPFSTVLDLQNSALNLFQLTACRDEDITPYDGRYTATGEIVSGKPTYVSDGGFVLEYAGPSAVGFWLFSNPADSTFGLMQADEPNSDKPWPSSGLSWTCKNGTGSYTYQDVDIACAIEPFPSTSPMSDPSLTPSANPTFTSPTKNPSVSPTAKPSPPPTVQPTLAPTGGSTQAPSHSPVSCWSIIGEFEDLCVSFIKTAEEECASTSKSCDLCSDPRIIETQAIIDNLQTQVNYLTSCSLSGQMQTIMEDLIAEIASLLEELQEAE